MATKVGLGRGTDLQIYCCDRLWSIVSTGLIVLDGRLLVDVLLGQAHDIPCSGAIRFTGQVGVDFASSACSAGSIDSVALSPDSSN